MKIIWDNRDIFSDGQRRRLENAAHRMNYLMGNSLDAAKISSGEDIFEQIKFFRKDRAFTIAANWSGIDGAYLEISEWFAEQL